MARGRYWRRYYRRYYRRKYGSASKLRMTKNFKASALNMTQGGVFNISGHDMLGLPVPAGTKTNYHAELNVATTISQAAMHLGLSNVFDQYRIERIIIRVRPIGDSSAAVLQQPSIIYSCVDRSGFKNQISLDDLRTYGSYRETINSGAKDVSPTHVVAISASNLVEWTSWTDTKKTINFPAVMLGCYYASLASNTTVNLSCEIDAQIRYRGVRYDNSAVSTQVSSN